MLYVFLRFTPPVFKKVRTTVVVLPSIFTFTFFSSPASSPFPFPLQDPVMRCPTHRHEQQGPLEAHVLQSTNPDARHVVCRRTGRPLFTVPFNPSGGRN